MASNKTCYWPNKSIASNLTACDPSPDTHGSCCGPNAVCLSNGLCFGQDEYANRIGRYGCTDPEYGSDCSSVCAESTDDGPTSLWFASPGGIYGGSFCCAEYDVTSERCLVSEDGTTVPFELKEGYVLFPNTTMTLESYAATTATDTCDSNETATTGVAVGVALGVPLLIAVVLIFWQWRVLRRLKKNLVVKREESQERIPLTPAKQEDVSLGATPMSLRPKPRHELSDETQLAEMSHEVERQELDVRR